MYYIRLTAPAYTKKKLHLPGRIAPTYETVEAFSTVVAFTTAAAFSTTAVSTIAAAFSTVMGFSIAAAFGTPAAGAPIVAVANNCIYG